MTPYWLLFLFPVVSAAFPFKMSYQLRRINYLLFATIATVMIGFRYQVGFDWSTYLIIYEKVRSGESMTMVFSNGYDPGYVLLNWLSVQIELGIVGVNLMCGALFIYGLLRLCRKQPFPWVGITVATPFLLIVVVMGVSRQGVAIGIILWALSEWGPGHLIRYSLLVIIATLFHKSAIIMLLLGFFIEQNVKTRALLMIPVIFLTVAVFFGDYYQNAIQPYMGSAYNSEGGLIRVIMNVFAAVILLMFQKRFSQFKDYRLWKSIALASIVCLPLVSFASTFVDRFALYFLPLQIVTYSRLPLIIHEPNLRHVVFISILFSYGFVLFVWLNFGRSSYGWLPYRMAF